MTLTIKLNPDAVWDDGTPITSADLECTCKATLNTPGSITTAGYDKITSIDASDPQTAVVTFTRAVRGRTRTCSPATGGIIKKDAVANCDDISGDLQDTHPVLRSSVEAGVVEHGPDGPRPQRQVLGQGRHRPRPRKVVMVPKADSDTEINSLKSGEVGMIFPQAFAGITDALNDPNIKYTPGYGTNYEGLYFQQSSTAPSRIRSSARPSRCRSTGT